MNQNFNIYYSLLNAASFWMNDHITSFDPTWKTFPMISGGILYKISIIASINFEGSSNDWPESFSLMYSKRK